MQMPGPKPPQIPRALLASARKALSLNLRARTSAARTDRSQGLAGLDTACLPWIPKECCFNLIANMDFLQASGPPPASPKTEKPRTPPNHTTSL